MLTHLQLSAPPKIDGWLTVNLSGHKCFPFNNFTYSLTLCSEFFSSFDHSTCALSVSCQYLALDGIYHPFRAAFPNNSTHWRRFIMETDTGHKQDSHPLWCPFPRNFNQSHTPKNSSTDYNSGINLTPDFKSELLPLHSPLLRQSLLVSFPPLIDMLKFSGYPYLIWGHPKYCIFLLVLIC